MVANTALTCKGASQAGLVENDWRGKAQEVLVAGARFENIRSAANHYGVNFKKVYDQDCQKGWRLEQALSLVSPPETTRYAGKKLRLWGGLDYA